MPVRITLPTDGRHSNITLVLSYDYIGKRYCAHINCIIELRMKNLSIVYYIKCECSLHLQRNKVNRKLAICIRFMENQDRKLNTQKLS